MHKLESVQENKTAKRPRQVLMRKKVDFAVQGDQRMKQGEKLDKNLDLAR